jgi:hypothetical protein
LSLPKPKRKGILELLDSSDPLKTPPFQRSFAWGKREIDEYWKDLKTALDGSGGPVDHFLGLVVLDNKDQIQDGQQRLASTLLLASEIYEAIELAKKSGSHDPQLAIDAAGAIIPALRQSPAAKLQIGLSDQDELMRRAGIRPDSPESTKRLAAARKRVRAQLSDDLSSRTTPDAVLGRLKQWGEYLRGGAYTVLLRVTPRDAHNIFETLNTRGVRLSNGDLVKSHLVGRASDINVAVSKWSEVTTALQDENGAFESDLESFLLHFYGSKYKRTTKAKFFADYRSSIEAVDPIAALDTLIANAKLYRALADPTSSTAFWGKFGPGAQPAVQLLNGLGLKQLRYLLLAILRDLGKTQNATPRRTKQTEAIVRVASWSIRGLVAGRTGGGDAEHTYINAASELRKGTIKTVPALRKYFRSRNMFIADDNVFEAEFATFAWDRAQSHTRARAVLMALEFQQLGAKTAIAPRDTLTLEHVLPQSPDTGTWTDFTDDERKVYTYDIGNLILVDGPSGANNALKNKEWADKKSMILGWGSQTKLTTEATSKRSWNKATIEARRAAMAKLAVKAWRV